MSYTKSSIEITETNFIFQPDALQQESVKTINGLLVVIFILIVVLILVANKKEKDILEFQNQ